MMAATLFRKSPMIRGERLYYGVLFVIGIVIAGRAPDIDRAASFPEGWCDLKYGTPTRSTGECMCRYRCEGRKCESAQGFIWYSYERCPDCKCVAFSDETKEASNEATIVDEEQEREKEPLSSMMPNFDTDDDRTFGEKVFDFFDENGHIIIALVFIIIIIVVLFPLLLFQIMATNETLEQKKSTTEAQSGDQDRLPPQKEDDGAGSSGKTQKED